MLDPPCFRTHEIVEINGLPPRPDTLRTAKIRDPTGSRNAGSSENKRVLSSAKVIGEPRSVALIQAQSLYLSVRVLPNILRLRRINRHSLIADLDHVRNHF